MSSSSRQQVSTSRTWACTEVGWSGRTFPRRHSKSSHICRRAGRARAARGGAGSVTQAGGGGGKGTLQPTGARLSLVAAEGAVNDLLRGAVVALLHQLDEDDAGLDRCQRLEEVRVAATAADAARIDIRDRGVPTMQELSLWFDKMPGLTAGLSWCAPPWRPSRGRAAA